ncbi:DUF7848 domain-containing protein [Streptomyces sp. NPDC055078]
MHAHHPRVTTERTQIATESARWVGRPSGPPYRQVCSADVCPSGGDRLLLAPEQGTQSVRTVECTRCDAVPDSTEGRLGLEAWALAHSSTTGHAAFEATTTEHFRVTAGGTS